MRTVFNSNNQLAKTFAAQSQIFGKSNSMFFEFGTAYSYGRHYIAAKFVTANNGEKICFVNSRYYSVTTSKHCGELWNAIPDGVKVFRVPLPRVFDLDQLPTIIKVMKDKHKKAIDKIMDWFDFSKVHRTMVALEWKWASAEDGIPTEPEIREMARRLMEDSINQKVSIGTGGFRVHYNKKDDFISLSFVVSEWNETF